MGFFDDIVPDPTDRARRAWLRPDGQVPTPVAVRLMLARSQQAAIAIIGLWSFTEGFEFLVNVQLREAIGGTSPVSYLSAVDDDEPGDEARDDEFLRLGIQFSTGEKTANTQPRTRISESAGPIMRTRIAGGSALTRDRKYWVSPLPPAGPLAFVCEWPVLDIPESRTEIDARLLLDAASESIHLWSLRQLGRLVLRRDLLPRLLDVPAGDGQVSDTDRDGEGGDHRGAAVPEVEATD
jgi:hypothetical protein